MINVHQKKINFIPCLIVTNADQMNDPLPLIIYFHGFTSAKEHNLPIAYLLAEQGYRVILPDSKYHGERERNVSSEERQVSFWDIVIQNVDELQTIRNYMNEEGLILNHRIGLAGTSMGGITTAAALTQYPWIKVAAVLMGSPKLTTYAKTLIKVAKKVSKLPITNEMIKQLYQDLARYDLAKQPHTLANRPLLFWHGENDSVVPFDHAYTFYDKVKKQYEDEENICLIREENRDHKVSRYAILETVKWFVKYL